MPVQVTYIMNSSCDVPYGHYFDYTSDRLSRAVSRVMSNALPHVIIIYLVLLLPAGSSDLPKGTTGSRIAFVWSCFGWGLHGFSCYHENGSLLHCLSTLTRIISWRYISVALSLESPPPDVIRHPAL